MNRQKTYNVGFTRIPAPHLLAFFAFILCCCMFAAPCSAARILAFGDSITYGLGSRSGGYPPKLQTLLNSHGKPATVISCGIPGERTPQGAARFREIIRKEKPDIVLILEGANDVKIGLPVEETRSALQQMLDICKKEKVTPVLATLTPSNRGNSEKLIPSTFNPMITNLAKENSVLLVDHYQAVAVDWSRENADGIHPNDLGYQVIAQDWYQTISPLISFTGAVIPPDNRSTETPLLYGLLLLPFGYLIVRRIRSKKKTTSPFSKRFSTKS